MGNLLTKAMGNVLTTLIGNVLTEPVGKVLDIYTTICFGLKHRTDMRTISESLLLDQDQVDFLGQLETGLAITKLQGRYFKPFLVKFPLFPVKKGIVSDSDVRKRMGCASEESEEIRPVPGQQNKGEEKVVLTEDERDFLIDIAKNPVSGVVSRYIRLGLNRYKGNKVQKELIDKDLIYFKQVSTNKGD